ncbi:conserved hypothetical protein [Talaromyces stipitatus ATCC 10500]|nr:uncharacterized protein TSTA_014020 [Talaromyces stipitatus ATCC 10500]EED16305.1 conserved hypothetical protein [Talaromyces stipitatus ATCC 10500]
MVHSTRFPTLVTVTVGSQVENSPVSAHSPVGIQDSWLLPFTDPRDQRKHNFRLHTLDIYFWTVEDADQFLDAVARILPPQQLESDRQVQQPQTVSEPAVSRVVEQLENVAITDPAYQNGQTRDSRSEPQPTSKEQPPAKAETTDYTPLAYNPAAPAAPEPIKHREKTPPPEDAGEGTGLVAAAVADETQHYPPAQGLSNFSHPQAYTNLTLARYGYSSPPPSAGLSMSQGITGPPSYSATTLAGPPPTQAGGMTFAPPPQNPNAHLFSQNSFDSQPHHAPHPQYADYLQQSHNGNNNHSPSTPEDERVILNGGYSNYSYAQPVQHQYGQLNTEYDIHNQIYIPTEAELKGSKHGKAGSQSSKSSSRGTKIEAGLGRMDSKVNGFLKKIEKRIG